MRRIKAGLGAFLFAVFSVGASAHTSEQAAKALISGLVEPDAPGCSLGVFQDGEWLFKSSFGLADLERQIPITPDHAFGIASVTKQFTAALAVIAAEEGFLALDDGILEYVPELRVGEGITIQHLIFHRSGLRDSVALVDLTGRDRYFSSNRTAILELISRQEALNFAPGTAYGYSNSNYDLLYEIIGRATGRPVEEYAEQKIFRPLGMNGTFYGTSPKEGVERAKPYHQRDGQWHEVRNDLEIAYPGMGGMVMPIGDYVRWADNLINPESKLVGGAALTETLRSVPVTVEGEPYPYGHGLEFPAYRGHNTISHGGSGGGYKSHTMIFPDFSIIAVGFCNNGKYVQETVMNLVDIFLDADSPRESKEASRILPPKALEPFVGTYRDPLWGLPMIVTAADGALNVRNDLRTSRYEAIGNSRFRASGDFVIEFEAGTGNKAARLKQIRGERDGSGVFERIAVSSPGADVLDDYIGDYRSTELDVTYRFSIKEGVLTAEILGAEEPASPLIFEPILDDEFLAALPHRLIVRFYRGAGDAVRGFSLTAVSGRAVGLDFQVQAVPFESRRTGRGT